MKDYKAVLFDLDGTLLPMDQDIFISEYFKALAKYTAPHGYETDRLVKAVWAGTGAMIGNDGTQTNEQAFWGAFRGVFGGRYVDKELFDSFYDTEFDSLKKVTEPTENADIIIKSLKKRGITVIVASSPIFPMSAHIKRMIWAGLDPDDFQYISAYENSRWCKPEPLYYKEIVDKNGLKPKDCLMVGNDVSDDLPAKETGMDVFIITDCLINTKNIDFSAYPHGGMADLMKFLDI